MFVVVGEIGNGFARRLGSIGAGVLAEVVDAGMVRRDVAAEEILQFGGFETRVR